MRSSRASVLIRAAISYAVFCLKKKILLQRRLRIANFAVEHAGARASSRANWQCAPAPLVRRFALLPASFAPRGLVGARFRVDKNDPLPEKQFFDEWR